MEITAYRRKKSSRKGMIGAGTFYFLNLERTCFISEDVYTHTFSFCESEVFCVCQEDALVFEGLPSEFLANEWFPEMGYADWQRKAEQYGFDEPGAVMDILVANEARKRGYVAIKYGSLQLQVL